MKFRSLGALINQDKSKIHIDTCMEMLEEGNEELQRMVTSPWTFSFPNTNACKYAFNLN
jgi:hypothetical protein